MDVEVASEVCSNTCIAAVHVVSYVGRLWLWRLAMASVSLLQGQGAAGGGEERPWKDWVLEKETELRLEAPEDTTVDVKVGNMLHQQSLTQLRLSCATVCAL